MAGQMSNQQTLIECKICDHELPQDQITVRECCGAWCNTCLKSIFIRTTVSGYGYPPKCCGDNLVDFSLVQDLLSDEETATWIVAKEMYNIPASARVYCANPSCARRTCLPNQAVQEAERRVKCLTCGVSTCKLCKSSHNSDDCPTAEQREIADMLKKTGFQKCPNCLIVVERTEGCAHIICNCMHEFCYHCGKKWKTCECSQDLLGGDDPNDEEEEANGAEWATARMNQHRAHFDATDEDIETFRRHLTEGAAEVDMILDDFLAAHPEVQLPNLFKLQIRDALLERELDDNVNQDSIAARIRAHREDHLVRTLATMALDPMSRELFDREPMAYLNTDLSVFIGNGIQSFLRQALEAVNATLETFPQ